MSSIHTLEKLVEELYESKNQSRADWADWLYENHVLWVAKKSVELSERFNANVDLTKAAALLHDTADAVLKRDDPNHEAQSLQIARDLMKKAGFKEEDITLVVDDAIKYHSCHGSDRPQSTEGKCLATADALAHLESNFYPFAIKELSKTQTLESINEWASSKLDRDFENKICFDEVKEEMLPAYNTLKRIFS